MPKTALVAAIVAFLIAGLLILSTLVTGPVILLPAALIPIVAGIGILKRRVWSAWGFALFEATPFVLLPLLLLRSRGLQDSARAELVTGLTVTAIIIPLFLFAGRSLAAAGDRRGSPIPWILLCVLVVLPFIFFQAFVLPTGSMEDTMLTGDRFLVRCFPRPTPIRGDMIAFIYPIDRHQTFVKRIVGVPGDRLRISQKILYRNGVRAPEPYATHKLDYMDSYRDNFPSQPNTQLYAPAMEMLQHNVVNGEVVVPERKYFVLGDNRDQSLDSRYWGFVDVDDLIGRPVIIYDSELQSTGDLTSNGISGNGRVRWNRLFKLL